MSLKTEPMDFESEIEDGFRMRSFTHSIIPKAIDLTDDQRAMQVPSPEEPYITGIFHRGANQSSSNHQAFNLLPSDISAMQQSHYYGGTIKSSPTRPSTIDEEYPTYTIARSEMELNSRSLPKKYKCKFCVYKTSYKSDLNRHLRRHAKKDNVYNCDICNMPFRSISKVYSHRQQVHMGIDNEEVTLACSLCSYKCTEKDLELFQLHVQQHIEDNTCNICNKSFNSPQAVDKHKKIYHQVTNEVVFPPQARRSVDVQYVPEGKSSSSASSFNRFVQDTDQSHAGGSSASNSRDGSNNSTPVPVTTCQSKGDNPRMSAAVKTNERSKIKNDERCLRNGDVNKLKATKIGNDLSDKAIQQSKNLTDIKSPKKNTPNILEAVDVTSSEKPDKSFSKKKFKCEKCCEEFLAMRELFIHMSVCMLEEVSSKAATNYNCPLCSFTTETLQLFTNHIVKHALEKFSCDICNKPFSEYRNVLSHKQKVHNTDQRKKRSPTKLKYAGFRNNNKFFQGSPSAKPNITSPYSKETLGKIKKLANQDPNVADIKNLTYTATVEDTDNINVTAKLPLTSANQGQIILTNSNNMSGDHPSSGRYARLISDLEEFMLKPFACSLCFYRTTDLNDLRAHVQNHISGCYGDSLTNMVRFNFSPVAPESSKIHSKETVYNITVTSSKLSTNQNTDIKPDVMETTSLTLAQKEFQNQANQIKYLENFIKNSKRNKNKIFLSRSTNANMRKRKPHSCEICCKEFSMRILAKRHMEKIHNVKNKL